MVAKFILFIRKGCPFCTRAKAMLDKHGLSYHSYIMDDHKDLFNEYCKSSNRYPHASRYLKSSFNATEVSMTFATLVDQMIYTSTSAAIRQSK